MANTARSEAKQRTDIETTYGDVEIYCDSIIESSKGRPHLYELLVKLEKGDTLVTSALSRISENAEEATRIYLDLLGLGVNVVFLKEPYFNTSGLMAAGYGDPEMDKTRFARRFITHQINDYFEAYEKDRMARKERLEEAVRKGAQLGTPGKLDEELKNTTMSLILSEAIEFGGKKTDDELIGEIGIARDSFYRLKNQLRTKRSSE